MTDTWQRVVAQLYSHLGVRPTRLRMTPANCPLLADVLHVLRQHIPVQIEPDVITAIALLAANVTPLPPSKVNTLPSLVVPVRLLVFQAAIELGVPREMTRALHRLTGLFFTVLQARLRLYHAPLPPIKGYPLAGFHARAWRDARAQGWILQYLAYALTVHQRLLTLWEVMARSAKPFGTTKMVNNLYRHCLGTRYLLPRLPRPASPAPSEPPDADLTVAIATISKERSRRRRRLLLRRASQFLRLFEAALTIRPATRSPGEAGLRARPIPSDLRRGDVHPDALRPSTTPGAPRVLLAEDDDDDEENATSSLRRLWIARQGLEDALAEGESVWDYADEFNHAVEPAAEDGRQAIWRRRWQRQRAIMAGQEPTLAARTLQPHDFARVYRVIFTSADEDSLEDRLVQAAGELFIEVVTIYGVDPTVLERAMLDVEPPGAGALWFNSTAPVMAYRMPREWVAWRDRPTDLPPGYCLPGSDLVRIPLLSIVARTLQRLIALRRDLGLTDPSLFALGGGRLLTAEAMDEALREYCGQRVTCRRLARSTLAWLRHYCAPHVVRSLVSARCLPPARGTLFYTNADGRLLARLLAKAITPFQGHIRDALATEGEVPGALAAPGCFDPPPSPTHRLGSLIVPDLMDAKASFEALRARLRQCPVDAPLPMLAETFNPIALYRSLGLLWLTGCRPFRDPFATAPIVAPTAWILVGDKGNRDYRFEPRLVPLSQTALALLTDFQEACQRIITLLALRGTALTPSGRIFFLAPTGDSTLPMTGLNMKLLLDQLGLRALYPYPLNAHRHLWVSRALEEGLLEVLEPYLGHLHVGTEPWGRFALAKPEEEAEQFRAFAERLAEEVGIIPVAHPFRN